MPSAALRVWNSPARPSPQRPWENQPVTASIPSSRQQSRLTRAFGAYTRMNFPEAPHVPGLMLKALCPSLTPALENPKLARTKTKQMPRVSGSWD